MGISTGSVACKHLVMIKFCAQWVPRMLDRKMKDCRYEASSKNLKFMQLNGNLFLQCSATGDKTWIHHYDPESKQQSMQWKHFSSPSSRKFKVQASAGRIMCAIFWDAEGMLVIDFMPHKVTATGFYYTDLLHKLLVGAPRKVDSGTLLHDNAPAHIRVRRRRGCFTWIQI